MTDIVKKVRRPSAKAPREEIAFPVEFPESGFAIVLLTEHHSNKSSQPALSRTHDPEVSDIFATVTRGGIHP